MTFMEVVYVGAGVALPAYYLPQVLRCASDGTQLASYSMSKSATQLVLRSAMLPFVYGIGNPTMTWVVSLDFAGRAVEFGAALVSLRRQQVAAFDVLRRCLPSRQLVGVLPRR